MLGFLGYAFVIGIIIGVIGAIAFLAMKLLTPVLIWLNEVLIRIRDRRHSGV